MKLIISFTDTDIHVIYNGKSELIDLESELGTKVLELWKENDLDSIEALLDSQDITHDDRIDYVDGELFVEGNLVDEELAELILKHQERGLPIENLLKFAEKIAGNPSFNSRKMLYSFLRHNGHPILDNGNFIAYKKINADFTDVHSGTFDNSVGQRVKMERSLVDDNPNNTCSSGLHVASWAYLKHFSGSKVVAVEVNPVHVVAVPRDYNGTKMRVCEYLVLTEVKQEID